MSKMTGFREMFDAAVEDELTGERFAQALAGPNGAWDAIVVSLKAVVDVGFAKATLNREAARQTRIRRADRLYAAEEAARVAAEIEIRQGVYISVNEAVVPPTPEWLAKHDTMPVTVQADGEGHHARSVKTVRRVFLTPVMRAHRASQINDRQFKACAWYADRYEETGLTGRISSAQEVDRIRSGIPAGIMFGDRQLEAIDEIKKASASIAAKYRRFFDLVVLQEIGVKRAERMAKCRRNSGMVTLRTCADEVADFLGLDAR